MGTSKADQNRISVLQHAIQNIESWTPERSITSIQDDFLQLRLNCPIKEDEWELWEELRTALKNNKHLHTQEAVAFLCNADWAKEGFWWYDYSEW